MIQDKYSRTLRLSPFPESEKRNKNNYSLELSTFDIPETQNIKNLKPDNVRDLEKVHHLGTGLSSDQNFVNFSRQTFSRQGKPSITRQGKPSITQFTGD